MPGFCREPGTSAIDACIGLKLLLDQNLSFRLLDKLEAAYPGSTQVKFVGLDQADDLTVWQFAKDNGFTIVTKDSDFHEFSLIYEKIKVTGIETNYELANQSGNDRPA